MYKRFVIAAALARALQPHIRRRHRSRLNRATSADEDGMVCTLERLYGTTSVWGDLDAAEARALYQQLLPRVLALPSKPPLNARPLTRAARKRRLAQLKNWRANRNSRSIADLRSRATAAAVARRAVRKYVRGRSILPLRALTHAGDGVRTYGKTGRWRLYGETTEELVARYASAARERAALCDGDNCVAPEDAVREAYAVLLEKSCSTNEFLDNLLLQSSSSELNDALPAAERFWRELPFRPSKLFPALEALQHRAARNDQHVTESRPCDDTDDVWNAFLLRCVEPPEEGQKGEGVLACRTSGFVLAPATRARWIARAAHRRAQKFRKPPVNDDGGAFGEAFAAT